jgi:hypothetical protein
LHITANRLTVIRTSVILPTYTNFNYDVLLD